MAFVFGVAFKDMPPDPCSIREHSDVQGGGGEEKGRLRGGSLVEGIVRGKGIREVQPHRSPFCR